MKPQPKNLACCVDNACNLRNCKSCMSYGTNEICNVCEEGYYFNTYSQNKCHSLEQIDEICDGYYSLDSIKQTFECLKCNNGDLQYNETSNKYLCVCADGYYGNECRENYNIKKCSGNGVYDAMNEYCICDTEFSGKQCEENIFHACLNGFYSRDKDSCICDYGFKGDKCDEKVSCNHGQIIFDTCICHNGFSGESCELPFPETDIMKLQKTRGNILISSYSILPCKNGVSINETCECFNGFIGSDCGTPICKYGNYEVDSDKCSCIHGYYGEYCEFNCYERCSYNGNICEKENIGKCTCNNSWHGDTCNVFRIENIKQSSTSNFSLTSSINIPYTTNKFNFSLQILENKMINSLPFKITSENFDNEYNNLRRGLKQKRKLQKNTSPTLLIDTTIGLNEQDDVYYIYPNNEYEMSYYSGKIINITHINNVEDYFVYIEKVRIENDNVQIIENNTVINSTNLNSTESEVHDNNQGIDYRNNIDILNYLTENYWTIIIGCALVSIITVYIVRRHCTKNKVYKRTIQNTINENTQNNHVNNNKSILTMNSNPLLRNKTNRNKIQYPIISASNIDRLQIYKHKTNHFPKKVYNDDHV
jgi:hypothetical protein